MSTRPSEQLTLADIARLAGVGVGTASRALSGSPKVAQATRERVLKVAEQHQYVVSPDASRLASRSTSRVAIVIPHPSRWFFGEMLEGLESVLRDADLDVLLYQVGAIADRTRFFEQLPARRKVDAVVVIAFPIDEPERNRLSLMGVHIVAAGGQSADYPYVCMDDLAAGRQAMDHLIHLGHQRIAMIEATDPDQPDLRSNRSTAYYDALTDHHLPHDPDLVVTTDWGGEQGAEAAAKLLSLRKPPTAIYAHSDEVALGAMRTIRRAGLRVPEDISIVGIDDHPLANLVDLTTVRQHVRQQGTIAGNMLLGLLRKDADVDRAVTVPTQLIIRHSTAPPPDKRNRPSARAEQKVPARRKPRAKPASI